MLLVRIQSQEERCLVTNNNKYPKNQADFNALTSSSLLHSIPFMQYLFLLPLVPTLVFSAGLLQIHGVHPSLLSHYEPKGTTWTCLDGNKTIPWSAVNDDYCDCIDGSDEPGIYFSAVLFVTVLQALLGTSACSGNTFYCANEGHIGASIPSSRVNDGLCGRIFALRHPPSSDRP